VLRTFATVGTDDVEVVVAFRMTARRAREVLARGTPRTALAQHRGSAPS
jgi:hypothetical protein